MTERIVVHGAGIFGLSVAFACARRGACVTVHDPAGPGAGASGGIVGALAPHVPENWNPKKAFQLDSLTMAEAFWAEVAELSGLSPGYARSGRLQPLADDAAVDLARQRASGAAEVWHGRAIWEVVEAGPAGPFAPVSPTGWLVRDTLTARLHPRRACDALAAALRRLGAAIVTEAPPAGIEVWATGYEGLRALSAETGRPAGTGVKGQAVLLGHAEPDAPQLFADGLHIVPHADGTVAVGSTSEREFDDPQATDGQCDVLAARARAACPALADAPVIARWAGVRPRARSRAPMLGCYPGRDGAYIANGGFKIGFGMAPKVGEVMADLIMDGHDTIPPDFRPEASL